MNKVDLCKELNDNFLRYAEATNSDRAIPDATSGLKPVARRILWMMHDNGFTSSKPHKKCAKTVGEVMGRVHPHGDSSIYEAMVRLSRPWVLRYPLIDFHGNNGNIAGDGAAAPRYTESRLSKIAEDGMLAGIKKKIVDFQPNYSEDEEEPVTLPSLMPNLLVNPNRGIGVSLACQWQPHNLTEVCDAILETLKGNVVETLPGPDFPTGGVIINKDELATAYKTGKGRAIVRGRYKIEERGRHKLIVFYEIPYDVTTEKLLEQINEYCEKEQIEDINEIRDESGKKGLRIVIEVDKDINEEKIVNKLFKGTDLQKSCSFNQVALVNKVPTLLNLKECINIYINHQIDIIQREYKFDLEKAKIRLHIVEGLLIALEDIDNVIALIKKSESAAVAKESLKVKYNLSEEQAKAILDMKLSKLAKLEKIELETERKELVDLIAEIESILSSEEKQKSILYDRLNAFKIKYGDARRTDLSQVTITKEEKEIETVIPEDVVVVTTENGYIKKVPKTSFRTQNRGGKGVKTQADITKDVIRTNTIDNLLVFSSFGKLYKILVDDIPTGNNTAKGVSINSLIPTMDNGEKPVLITSVNRNNPKKYIIFVTKNGMIKKTSLEEYKNFKKKGGIIAIKLKENDAIADIAFAEDEDVIIITKGGYCIRFNSKEVGATGRATVGVKAIKLNDNDEVIRAVLPTGDDKYLGVIYKNGLGKKVDLEEFTVQGRAGKGIIISKNEIADATLLSDEDSVLITSMTSSICITSQDIPTIGRTAAGNTLIKNGNVISMSRI